MIMRIGLSLDDKTNNRLYELSKELNISKSAVMREAITLFQHDLPSDSELKLLDEKLDQAIQAFNELRDDNAHFFSLLEAN
ncbi:MAG: ribbon-helix-helix protein, CopG family [bacterium]